MLENLAVFVGMNGVFLLVFGALGYRYIRTRGESEVQMWQHREVRKNPPGGAGGGAMIMAIRFPKRFVVIGLVLTSISICLWILDSLFF
jgi:hypothetical protein